MVFSNKGCAVETAGWAVCMGGCGEEAPGSSPKWQFYALYTLTENIYLKISNIKHLSIQEIAMT